MIGMVLGANRICALIKFIKEDSLATGKGSPLSFQAGTWLSLTSGVASSAG